MKGYYSLIQYCPDKSRLESVNIGVLLFCPEISFLKLRNESSFTRLKAFFGQQKFDSYAVSASLESLESRLDMMSGYEPAAIDEFIGKRANEITMTALRSVKVQDPEKMLNDLFDELVRTPKPEKEDKKKPFPEIDRIFRQPELKGKISFDLSIKVPVIDIPFKVPYAYRNGKLNLVRPESFSSKIVSAVNQADRLIVQGNLIQKHKDESGTERCLIVIPEMEKISDITFNKLEHLFNEFDIRFIPPRQLESFAAEIRQQAH